MRGERNHDVAEEKIYDSQIDHAPPQGGYQLMVRCGYHLMVRCGTSQRGVNSRLIASLSNASGSNDPPLLFHHRLVLLMGGIA